MEPLPTVWQQVVDELRAERAEQGRQLSAVLTQLDTISKMLRRREAQVARLVRENRRLRRKLGLSDPDDDPEPDASSASPSPDPPGSTPADPKPKAKKPRPRSRGGRRPPPPHLPENRERHEVCACGRCGGKVWSKGVETSRHYTVVKAHVRCRVVERERERVKCVDCGASTTAEMPPMPVQRALYDCSFLAWLVTMKFAMLIPLDRVRTQLASQAIDLAMGTLVHLIARAAKLAKAVDDVHWAQLKSGPYMGFDGTGLKTLIRGQKKAWDGYLEVYTRDDLSVFRYDLTKHADSLAKRLDGYRGTLMCDAKSRNLAAAPDNVIAHCLAHPLRKFRDAETVQPKLAAQGRRFIEALYELEDEARAAGLSGEALGEFRNRRSRRVLRRFHQWLEGVVERRLPPSDPVAKTARYMLKHWDGLSRFTVEPALPLDNNASEREFQPHAKLRYASLFAGSVAGAHRWAVLLGVIRTAQKCGVHVESYLTWLFDHMGTHREKLGTRPDDLTPMAYKALVDSRAA